MDGLEMNAQRRGTMNRAQKIPVVACLSIGLLATTAASAIPGPRLFWLETSSKTTA